jgi:hypothetical protein
MRLLLRYSRCIAAATWSGVAFRTLLCDPTTGTRGLPRSAPPLQDSDSSRVFSACVEPACGSKAELRNKFLDLKKKWDDPAGPGRPSQQSRGGSGPGQQAPAIAVVAAAAAAAAATAVATAESSDDCPLDREELGRYTWGLVCGPEHVVAHGSERYMACVCAPSCPAASQHRCVLPRVAYGITASRSARSCARSCGALSMHALQSPLPGVTELCA